MTPSQSLTGLGVDVVAIRHGSDSDQGGGGRHVRGSVSRFVLSLKGRVFHVPGCDVAGNARPWAWAEPLTDSQIRRWIEPLGVRACRRCDPLAGA